MTAVSFAFGLVAFGLLAPVLGCLLTGADRIITARLQGRVGPPLLQPLYDVLKLLAKEKRQLQPFQGFYILLALILAILAGAIFFAGGNLLVVVFLISLSTLFFIIAAYSARSPFAELGAEREIIQVLSYEPMIILMPAFFFMVTGSFDVSRALSLELPPITQIPLIFVGLLFVLTTKLRKSPFDLSFSHHAHQELVKGITTEMSGRTLALVEITHWYETVLFLGYAALFFVWGSPFALVIGLLAALAIYFLEIIIDNSFARVKWQAMLGWSWLVTVFCAVFSVLSVLVVKNYFL
ncbi:MAG: NADH-quinone oxidoreductase subunit H [Coriobacteriales bacterium]|jgi:formate hydrogenlyase subunit 4|nr:NADH-quinone oxidoreductase subunit H [Coriobacteriales bacterium]